MSNPNLCFQRVTDSTGWHRYQCSNKPKKDGFCTIHHPDYIKEKNRKKEERWAREAEAEKKQKLRFAFARVAKWMESEGVDSITLEQARIRGQA